MFNNPYYYDQARKNMTPENVRMASERLGSMSDEELRNMSKMAGLNISPEMLKTSANMFKNMNPEEIERMKNMSAGMNFGNFGANPGGANPFVNPSSGPDQSNAYKKSKTADPFESSKEKLAFPKIEALKKKGNDFFSKNQYEEASTAYFEAILEIEEIKMNQTKYDKEEIKRLELACRLNYANTKSKMGEYEIVLTQAREVLKYGDNGKAYFRVGQALHHLGRNEMALQNLEKALKFLSDDPMVVTYLEKAKAALSDKAKENKENSVPNQTEEAGPKKEEVVNNPVASKETSQIKEEEKSQFVQQTSEDKREKIKKKKVKLESLSEENEKPEPKKEEKKEATFIKKEEQKEVLIEEEKAAPPQQSLQFKPAPSSSSEANKDKINNAKKSAEQLKNMSPEQMNMMTDYFKNMDNNFLRQMMKQQTGVEMSDAELANIKNMMTPDMLKMMSGMDFDSMNMNNMSFNNNPNDNTGTMNQTNTNPPQMPQNMNFSNLMQNSDMINGMMENMKKNPEMLKNMSKMLGENHPLSGLLNKSSPEDLQKMMNVMQGLVGVLGKVSRGIGWIKTNWKLVGFICVMMILYYFYF